MKSNGIESTIESKYHVVDISLYDKQNEEIHDPKCLEKESGACGKLIKSVPEEVVVTIADFSENYRCVHQDEIQSAYYNYNQETVFPMKEHYRSPDCKDSVVQVSAVLIFPDLTHDATAVEQFSKRMVEHIQGHVHVSKEVQFSDGSACQDKSKVPFLHVSDTNKHTMEKAIQNAQQLFDSRKENLTMHEGFKCVHKKRVFFYQRRLRNSEGTLCQRSRVRSCKN